MSELNTTEQQTEESKIGPDTENVDLDAFHGEVTELKELKKSDSHLKDVRPDDLHWADCDNWYKYKEILQKMQKENPSAEELEQLTQEVKRFEDKLNVVQSRPSEQLKSSRNFLAFLRTDMIIQYHSYLKK